MSFPEELDMTPFMSNSRHLAVTSDDQQMTLEPESLLSSENKLEVLINLYFLYFCKAA